MTAIKAFVKSHALLSFYALAFAITWGGLIMVVGGPGEILGTPERFETRFALVLLAWLAGPSVASIVLTGLVHGRAGFRDLLARMTKWRVGARWYAVALLTAPLLVTAVLLALSLTSSEYLPAYSPRATRLPFLLFGVIGALVVRRLRGARLDRVRHIHAAQAMRYGVLATGLIVGVLWGAWHLLALCTSGEAEISSGELPLALLLPAHGGLRLVPASL